MGCPFSLRLRIMSSATRSHSPPGLKVSVAFHFVSVPRPRNDQWLEENFFTNLPTRVELSRHTCSFCGFPHTIVVVQRHEDDPFLELFWFSSQSFHKFLVFMENLHRCESWEDHPLEFHRLSVGRFHPILCIASSPWTNQIWVSHSLFDTGNWRTFPRHNTESENTWTFAVERLITSPSFSRNGLSYAEVRELISDTPEISNPRSWINFWITSNTFFTVGFSVQVLWVISFKIDTFVHWWRHEYFCKKRMFINVVHLTTWKTIQHYSQSRIHFSLHENNSARKQILSSWCLQTDFNDKTLSYGSPGTCSRILHLVRAPCCEPLRTCHRSCFCVPLLRIRHCVNFSWLRILVFSYGSPRCFQTNVVTFRSEIPRAGRCRRSWHCWRPCTTSRYQISHRSRFGGNPFFAITFLQPLRPGLGAALRSEKADIKQTQKVVPFITCEVSFGQNVCELVFGVDVFDLDLGVQVISVEKPVKSNSVAPWNMSECQTSAFDDHLDYCFVFFKDVQHSSFMTRIRVWGDKIDIGQFKMSLRNWSVSLRIELFLECFTRQRVSSSLVCLSLLIWVWMHHINNQIPKIKRGNTVHS